MARNHIALDLELEKSNHDQDTPDSHLEKSRIIQIGWVVFQTEPRFQELEIRCQYINIGVPLSRYIRKLTKISDEDIANGTSLKAAYKTLQADREKHDCNRKLIAWGAGDGAMLKKELPEDVEWDFGKSDVNVKHLYQIYAEANGLNPSGGLSKCVNAVGLNWRGHRKHNATTDARNTALLFNFFYHKLKEK